MYILYSFILSRISLRKDTCNIAAISLNTSEKTSTVIWHAHSLPYDSVYALPVPTPIGQFAIIMSIYKIHTLEDSNTL